MADSSKATGIALGIPNGEGYLRASVTCREGPTQGATLRAS